VSKPVRIQLSRKKGWRMPPNTVRVARPGKWGNPCKVGDYRGYGARDAAEDYRLWIQRDLTVRSFENACGKPPTVAEIQAALRGKNLACWCPLSSPCHADVLLDIANR